MYQYFKRHWQNEETTSRMRHLLKNNRMAHDPLRYANKGDLTNGPVRKHLIRMTVPMIWGMLSVISVQLINTYFVSMLGTDELAGMSFTFPVTMVLSHFVFGLNIALSSVIARLIGQKKMDDARRVTLHGITLAVFISAIVAIVCYIFLEPIFHKIGVGPETMHVIHAYMPLWLVASVVLAIPVNANSAIRAAGDAFMPSIVMISIALLNLCLDPILIFGLFGLPALGVKGAAISTLISYTCGLVGALYILIFKKNLVSTDGFHLDKLKDSLSRLLIIAVPASITTIIQPLAGAIIVALLSSYGNEVVAAYGVVTRVEAFSMLFVIALSLGMAPIVGQNWGAEKFDRVNEVIKQSIQVNFIWSFFVAAVFGLFARQIGGLFSQDPEVVAHVTFFFWIVPFSYGFGNLVFGWCSAFNAMGKPQRAFVMIFIKAILFSIPAAWLGSKLYGVEGIFWSITITNLISGIIAHIISKRAMLKKEHEIALSEPALNH